MRTRFGNWIFASGGDPRAARKSGVPVARVKTTLFVVTALCATLVAILTVLDAGSTDARRGFQKEFEAIIAAVIGGCLLTGGYGSAIGAFFGSIVFGMVLIGLTYTSIDQDWYLVFLGGMLLTAVVSTTSSANASRENADEHISDAPRRGQNLVKHFGSVIALNGVSMSVNRNEVLCLLGDNGAGKSTLINTLAGVHKPTSGDFLVDGQPRVFSGPRDALDAGIATVYQDLAMIPLMSVTRNFFMGREPLIGLGPFKRMDMDEADNVTRDEMHKIGIDVRDPQQAVGTLSGGERQCVAIARAVYFGAKVLILDERHPHWASPRRRWC